MDKDKLLKAVKVVGSLLTVVSLVFIIQRLQQYDLNSILSLDTTGTILVIASSLIYGIVIFLGCIPWKYLIEIISGLKIPFIKLTRVNTKSNLYKYVPGNVFQYVGKSQIALEENISIKQVSISIVLDLANNVLAGCIISIPYFLAYVDLAVVGILILVGLLILMGIYFLLRHKDWFKNYIDLLKEPRILKCLAITIIYRVVNYLVTGYIYVVLFLAQGVTIQTQEIPYILGAFTFAWLVGFLTPGAPAGIGIRESMLLLLLGNSYPETYILSSMIIFRICGIIGDILGYIYAEVVYKIANRKNLEE